MYLSKKETKGFIKRLNRNHYELKRTTGGHRIFNNGNKTVSIPIRLNYMISKRLEKELNLI